MRAKAFLLWKKNEKYCEYKQKLAKLFERQEVGGRLALCARLAETTNKEVVPLGSAPAKSWLSGKYIERRCCRKIKAGREWIAASASQSQSLRERLPIRAEPRQRRVREENEEKVEGKKVRDASFGVN